MFWARDCLLAVSLIFLDYQNQSLHSKWTPAIVFVLQGKLYEAKWGGGGVEQVLPNPLPRDGLVHKTATLSNLGWKKLESLTQGEAGNRIVCDDNEGDLAKTSCLHGCVCM